MRQYLLVLLCHCAFAIDTEEQGPHNIDCTKIIGDVPLQQLKVDCSNYIRIYGNGYLLLDTASEQEIYDFFKYIEEVHMGLKMTYNENNPKIVNLRNVSIIGNERPGMLGVWIENTLIEQFIAPALKSVAGIRIRGNRFLNKEGIQTLNATADPRKFNDFLSEKHLKYRKIQQLGECNIDQRLTFPNFTECPFVNNLIIERGYTIPEHFKPSAIYGCIFLNGVESNKSLLENIDFRHDDTFDCGPMNKGAMGGHKELHGIINNFMFCIRANEKTLEMKKIINLNNGNPQCKFKCKQSEISEYHQRFCEILHGDLIIDEKLTEAGNLSQITSYLSKIDGAIKIRNLRSVDYIDLRQLEYVTGGSIYQDVIVSIENTTLKSVLFEKITAIYGGENAVVVSSDNENFEFTNLTEYLLKTAANGLAVVKQSETEEENELENQKANTNETMKKGHLDDIGDNSTEKNDDNSSEISGGIIALIVCVIVGCCFVVVVVVVLAVFFKTRKARTAYSKEKTEDVDKHLLAQEYSETNK